MPPPWGHCERHTGLLTVNCGCGSQELVLRFRRADGSLVYPTIDPVGLTATVEIDALGPVAAEPAVATAATFTEPSAPIGLDPNSPVRLAWATETDGTARLMASLPESTDPAWGPDSYTVAGGVAISPGGVNRHDPEISVAAGHGLVIDADDRLAVDGNVVLTSTGGFPPPPTSGGPVVLVFTPDANGGVFSWEPI